MSNSNSELDSHSLQRSRGGDFDFLRTILNSICSIKCKLNLGVEIVYEILRITGIERWEALVKIISPPTDKAERELANKMLDDHIHNIARIDSYIDRLKELFKKALAQQLMLEQRNEHPPEAAAPPKKHYRNKKHRRNKRGRFN